MQLNSEQFLKMSDSKIKLEMLTILIQKSPKIPVEGNPWEGRHYQFIIPHYMFIISY
jgi:hypothetical protein